VDADGVLKDTAIKVAHEVTVRNHMKRTNGQSAGSGSKPTCPGASCVRLDSRGERRTTANRFGHDPRGAAFARGGHGNHEALTNAIVRNM
jgi:hypothetical protein